MCIHDMCDLCGRRKCSDRTVVIRPYGTLHACEACVDRAVSFSYKAACTWGGTTIDTAQPCGKSAGI